MSLYHNLLALLIISIWGFNFVVISWGVDYMTPFFMGAGRFFLVALIGMLLVKRPNIPVIWLVAYALTLCFGQFAFLFYSIEKGMPAGLASLVLQSQAMFTIVFSALALKENISKQQVLALAVAGVGLASIAFAEQASDMTLIGFVLTITAAISWAIGNVINKIINQRGYKANLSLVVWSAWAAFIPFFVASWLVDGPTSIWQQLTTLNAMSIFVLLYLAVAASMVGYSLWSKLLQNYGAGQVAPLTLAVPVVGMVSATYFLDETLTNKEILGCLLVMAGLIINSIKRKPRQKPAVMVE